MEVMRFSPPAAAPWLVSLGFHAGLVALAVLWVFRSALQPGKPPEDLVFAMPGGGSPVARQVQVRSPVRPPPAAPSGRILSRSAESVVALAPGVDGPSLPSLGLAGSLSARGTLTTASGVGSGSALGGSGAGFVGKPVMGARIAARRLAVYLDSSGSMRPHLARVEAEIRREFPDADVFRFDGARIVVIEGRVAEGRGYNGPSSPRRPGQSDPASLTPAGRRLLERLAPRCEAGSLGAWIDWMLEESYDGLVVFSDFQDGIRQYRDPAKGPLELIFADTKRRRLDERRPGDDRWQKAWLDRFAQAGRGRAPRLYLFSSETEPQAFLRQCAVASGGAVSMVEVGRAKPAR
jgi:hypothetical protein